jgi:hypothetical protein
MPTYEILGRCLTTILKEEEKPVGQRRDGRISSTNPVAGTGQNPAAHDDDDDDNGGNFALLPKFHIWEAYVSNQERAVYPATGFESLSFISPRTKTKEPSHKQIPILFLLN